jgi:hypothetical protein
VAHLRADSAVLVHPGVLLTFPSAGLTSDPAGFQERRTDADVGTAPTYQNRASRRTNISAVEVRANTLPKLGDHLFGHAGLRAGRTHLGTFETGLDAFRKHCLIHSDHTPWV